jgi:hypothetical protein
MFAEMTPQTMDHHSPPPILPIEGWGLFEVHEDTELQESLERQGVALVAQSLLDQFDELSIGSADNEEERSDINEDNVPEPTVAGKSLHLPL